MQHERTKARSKSWIVIVIVGFLLILFCVVGYILWHRRHQPATVQVLTVRAQTMKRTIFAAGQVKPVDRQIIYASTLSVPVKKLDVHVGEHVKQGQPLLELDNTSQQAAIASAESTLAQANAAYQRALAGYNSAPSLLKQVWLPQVDAAQSAVDQAQDQLDTAQAQLAATKVTANFTGIVLIANMEGVDASGQESPVIELAGAAKQIVIELSEVDATHAQKGMRVSMTSDAYPNQTFKGVVSQVAPYAQTTDSGTGQVEVDVTPKGTFQLPYGYDVDCTIASATHSKVPTIPYTALVQEGTNYAVYVLEGNRVKKVTVQLGITNNTSVEVVKGVSVGQKIINNPPENLQNNRVVNTK
ncbi:efflux RND transporter periplasmic adaptor subunit [Alicyclobacillus fodiniaquatilis]|uniref:Efflux RND transporter periplasmic adaptor subunit n=1 Tax=Alicyclobacillus fodiniaquatilis TaxID=1661150 RepID=A0ABW4JF08_9BACL